MKRKKRFDCVQMKWDIQRRLDDEFMSMSEDEARRIMDKRVNSDPMLGPFFRRIQAARPRAAAISGK